MLRIISALAGTVLVAFTIVAQQPIIEPGNPAALSGVSRIHVAASSSEARQKIVSEIKRQLPQLTITDNASDAQVWLVFRTDEKPKNHPASRLTNPRSTVEEYEIVGVGEVFKPVSRERAQRLLKFTDSVTEGAAARLRTEFADAFVKAYKKANQ